MWKTVVLAAGLVGLGAASAQAGPQGIREGGCIPVAQLKGKLIQQKVPLPGWCGTPNGNRAKDFVVPLPRFIDEWALQSADGKITPLILGDSKAMAKKAQALRDTSVVVTGTWSGGKLLVSSLEAQTVVLSGKLKRDVLHLERQRVVGVGVDRIILPCPPVVLWSLEVGGKTYRVAFANNQAEKSALALVGKAVRATGKLEGGTFTVSAVELDVITCCPLVPLGPALP
jgi:hypothetical protein